MANAVTTTPKATIANYLNREDVQLSIANVIEKKDMKRFTASIVSAVQTTPALADCTNRSILSAALLGESLKLPPSPSLGFFYMMPFKNNKTHTTEASFLLGYKGYVQLAIRSGQYSKIVASEVKEGEIKGFNPITEEFELSPVTDMVEREKLPVVGYYAMIELTNGFRKELYWSKEKMEAHATQYSQGYRSDKKNRTAYTFWSKDFDGMAKKTLLRQIISKWGIMSIEMERAFTADMAVIDDDGQYRYPDNEIDIKADVQSDIDENANTIEFDDVIEADAEVVEDGEIPTFLQDM